MNQYDRTFLREFGDALRRRRLDADLTHAELAKKCGLHRTFIGSIERGERYLSILNLKLVALVLRVSLSELMVGLL